MRGRPVLYAALALAVPLPALALTGGGSAEASLSVSASLDGCGTSSAAIVCRIDATWNEIPGAERYTASVTRADGSVVDFGDVGSGGSSFTVPYAGNGTYTVTVSAYGTPPGSDEPEVVARDTSGTGGDSGEATVEAFGEATTDDGPGEGEVPPDPGTEPPTEPPEPVCEEPEPAPVPEEPPTSEAPVEAGADGEADADAAVEEEPVEPVEPECPPAATSSAG